jgi:hypothetical protein
VGKTLSTEVCLPTQSGGEKLHSNAGITQSCLNIENTSPERPHVIKTCLRSAKLKAETPNERKMKQKNTSKSQ